MSGDNSLNDVIDAIDQDAKQAAIERLRRECEELDAAAQRDGLKSGRIWAMNRAEAKELKRLEALYAQCGSEWDSYFNVDDNTVYGPGEHFVFRIRPDSDGDRGEAINFWNQNVGDDYKSLMYNSEFVRAFAEGALEFWDEVEPQL